MKYILMDYVKDSGWTELSNADKQYWLGAYLAYVEAMKNAGVLIRGGRAATRFRCHDRPGD